MYFQELREAFINLQLQIRPTHVVEVGAREAAFSLQMRSLLPHSKIHAFEANSHVYQEFYNDIVSKDISYHNLGISNNSGVGVFLLDDSKDKIDGSHSFLGKSNKVASYSHLEIEMITLDNALSQDINDGASFCLWIDAEGLGYQVLEGARNVLEHTQSIFIEVEHKKFWENQTLAPQIIELLATYDFHLVARDMEFFPVQENYIFINPWRAKFV
jgi:FkbM family methyltransferase